MLVVAYGDVESEEYDAKVRGRCPICNAYVWTDQPRVSEKGVYYHSKCPVRCGGLIEELKKWDQYWRDRDAKWDLEIGKNVYVRK